VVGVSLVPGSSTIGVSLVPEKLRTYLNEENEPVTKKRRMFTGLAHSMLVATLSKFARNFFLQL
jgi:hypothetical protein